MAAPSAKLPNINPFHAVRTFSSRPGLTRRSRMSKSFRRPSSITLLNFSTETSSRLAVSSRDDGIVVKHLLEMRHEPLRVHRVTMKSAAELIVHAAFGHLAARMLDHFPRVA